MIVQCDCGSSGGCYKCNPLKSSPVGYTPVAVQKCWECPRCERIYGPLTTECWNCNNWIAQGIKPYKPNGTP